MSWSTTARPANCTKPTPARIQARRAASSTGEGNYWAAGRGGSLIKFDIKDKRIHEYPLPTPYTSLYTAKADKNGEVWAGELNGGRYLRFDPKTEQFTAYTLPEPFSMDRESWIDNSTNPVSVWYVDHDGWLVHIQPLD